MTFICTKFQRYEKEINTFLTRVVLWRRKVKVMLYYKDTLFSQSIEVLQTELNNWYIQLSLIIDEFKLNFLCKTAFDFFFKLLELNEIKTSQKLRNINKSVIYGVKKIFVINSVEMQTQLQEASCLNVWGELSWVVPSCLELGASLVLLFVLGGLVVGASFPDSVLGPGRYN